MKHLMLLRHAKAMPAAPGASDRERPLAQRGERDARLVGAAIVRLGAPDLILVSPARRTRETLSAILTAVPNSTRVLVVPSLYGASGTYLDIIAANAGDAERLMVIGHNPTIHLTALAVAANGDRRLRESLATKFPTCALAVSRLAIDDWRQLKPGNGELVAFVRPQDLGAADTAD